MKDYYYCYSFKLQRALYANGFKSICSGVNIRNGHVFWLYESTPELNDYKNNVYPHEKYKYAYN